MKKSKKVCLPLNDIVRPFLFIPSVSIEGGINGKMFYFQKDKPVELTIGQYELLVNAGYQEELNKEVEKNAQS